MWLRFLDSYRLMSSSLSVLSSILSEDEFTESLKLVRPDQFELIRRKGVYPYDYVHDIRVFEEISLPPREAFYNQLNDEECSQEDYAFAHKVWNELNMKNFGQYHDFYLSLDVCLLTDILTSFRKTCLEAYKIDCCHQYTAPGLAYNSMLRMTQVSLQLITDLDQMLFIESAIRGGLVQSVTRYAKANSPLLSDPSDYNSEEPTSYLFFVDCNSLYGESMKRHLPSGNFSFVEDPGSVEWSNLAPDSPHGFILEADVEFPPEIHDKLQDLPILTELETPPGSKTKKLMATLNNKHKYIAHYTVFQLAARLGLKITKIHRALTFSQSAYIKKFVDFNADRRAQSTNAFYRNVYKLMNNASYGRLLMNKRNQRDVRIVTSEHALQKLILQPRFAEYVIISQNVVAVHMNKKSVKLNAPIYAGMCVLDISKVHMFSFFYDVLCKHFKTTESSLRLCYTDTDSYLLYIKTEQDFFKMLKQPSIAKFLDQSSYPSDHPLRNDENKSKIGCFKDEARDGKQIQEYVGLKAKMYAYRYSSKEDDAKLTSLKAKGIKQTYVKKHLRFDMYKQTLLTGIEPEKAQFNLIRSRMFRLTSATVIKKSLSASDDKRQIMDDGISTLPYGHYRLQQRAAQEDSDDVGSDAEDV